MTPSLPWIERRWTFDFPVGVYPTAVERLRGAPPRVEEAVRGLSPVVLTRRDGQTWSIQENVGHMVDLEHLPMARVEEFLSGASTLSAADMSNRATWQAAHNERRIDDLLGAFREARARLVARLDGLQPADFARIALHPRLKKPMRLVDLCVFQADHDDYHLTRITQLKRVLAG